MSRTGNRRVTIVFGKAPRPGAVKTRLIPQLGADAAAALQARLIAHTLATACSAAAGTIELHADTLEDEFIRSCAARFGSLLVLQQGADLGERMAHAFQRALSEQGSTATVLIGTDCPALEPAHIRKAFDALEAGHDCVLAPAEDGGYTLIGLTRVHPQFFRDIPWGTEKVLDATRARVCLLGWRCCELDTLWDVDRPKDWERLCASGLLTAEA
jgi:uncharacterized protein